MNSATATGDGRMDEETMMKKFLLAGAAVLALSACSEKAEDRIAATENAAALDDQGPVGDASAPTTEAAKDAAEQPPGIDANVAPGVAFDYRYAFSLPETQIARVQEEHAALCGKLGAGNCRVTGLTFTKERNGEIDANMEFKLNPALALRFGRDATDLVARAEGKLETSAVAGEDVGSQIVDGDKSADGIKAELAKIEAQLKIPNLSKDVRSRLVDQAGELRAQLRSQSSRRDAQVESLATTPMVFTYEAGEAVMGFERGTAVQTGLTAGARSMEAITTALAFILGAFGPWLLLAGAGFWGWRRFGKRKANAE
jgi:hypothetical protein